MFALQSLRRKITAQGGAYEGGDMRILNGVFASAVLAVTGCEAPVSQSALTSLAEPSKPAENAVIIGQSFQITSSVYGAEKTLVVRLPAEYEASPEKYYPVVYLIDGGADQDFPHIAGLAQHGDISGTFEPFILVGVETQNRRNELTPPADDPRYDEDFKDRGGSQTFRQYIRDDVTPWVEARYRTLAERTVMGESLAGLFITETLLRDPDLFTNYIAVSPSLWWDGGSLVEAAADLLANLKGRSRRVYFTMGNEGGTMQAAMDRLVAALQTSAPTELDWSYIDRRGSEEHGGIYHFAALDALRTFFLTPYRTGSPTNAFYIYPSGVAPPLSARAQGNVKLECNKASAVETTFAEVNADPAAWRGMCVLMKPGTQPGEIVSDRG
jgi:predicted alpha/beta superfamily hydrolase